MAIADPYLAFCFDEAVTEFGAFVSSELSQIDGKTIGAIKAKQELALKSLLGNPKERFAQPVVTTTNVNAFADMDEVGNA